MSRLLLQILALAAISFSCGRDPAARTDPPRPPAPQVLAQARAEWAELTIQVVEVTRRDGSLVVRLRFANHGTQPFEFGDRFAADPADRDTIADVALLEPSGQRKYFVLRDRENRPQCSRDLTPLQPGEERLVFVRFPAPLAGTSRITIQVPHVPDLPQVPVTGGQNGPDGV